jgi:hypothetical protein
MIVLTNCKRCGVEFVPDRRAIVAGSWRLCPDCRRIEPATTRQQNSASRQQSDCTKVPITSAFSRERREEPIARQ